MPKGASTMEISTQSSLYVSVKRFIITVTYRLWRMASMRPPRSNTYKILLSFLKFRIFSHSSNLKFSYMMNL